MATSYADFTRRVKVPEPPRSSSTSSDKKKSKKGSGNQSWLSSIISELGGAGGAAGGAAAGATLGSVVPGIGNIIGGIGGGIIGGFTGGFGGRLAENQIRDKEMRVGDALKEGLVSGAFGAVGPTFQGIRGLGALGKAAPGGAKFGTKAITGARALSGLGDDATKIAAGRAISSGGKKAGQAIASGGLDDLTKAAKLTAGRNTLERGGNSAYRQTLGIDDIIMPGKTKPTTVFKADDLAGEARRIGLKGSPAQMERQVAEQYNRFNKQVASKLAESKNLVSTKDLFTSAESKILKQLPITIDNVAPQDELLRSLIQLDDLAKNGKVNATQISKFKNSLNVDSAFRKLSGDLSSPLTAKETVDLALWKEADNWISSIAPAAKELTKRQSRLYGLAQGLGRMTRTPGDPNNFAGIGIRALSPTIRKGQNAIGRGMLNAGNLQAGAGSIPGASALPAVIRGTATRGIANQFMQPAVQDPTQEQAQDAMQGYQNVDGGILTPDALYGSGAAQQGLGGAISGFDQPQAPQQYNPYAPENLQSSISQILQQGGDQGDIKDFLSIATAMGKLTETGAQSGPNITKVTGQQYQLAQRGAQAVDQLEQLLQSDPGVLKRSAAPGRKLPIVGGFIAGGADTTQFDALAYNVASAILRIETGAQANPEEIKNLQSQMMPRAGDSPEDAAFKLQQLRNAFAGILDTANQTGPDYAQASDLSSAMQYSPY